MNQTRTLPLNVHLVERERETHAEVRIELESGIVLTGHGVAHRHPQDSDVPVIGDELATARALSELSHRLLETAASTIGGIEHRKVQLTL